jgi:hypothetical protein
LLFLNLNCTAHQLAFEHMGGGAGDRGIIHMYVTTLQCTGRLSKKNIKLKISSTSRGVGGLFWKRKTHATILHQLSASIGQQQQPAAAATAAAAAAAAAAAVASCFSCSACCFTWPTGLNNGVLACVWGSQFLMHQNIFALWGA